jgi:hypothetical protein
LTKSMKKSDWRKNSTNIEKLFDLAFNRSLNLASTTPEVFFSHHDCLDVQCIKLSTVSLCPHFSFDDDNLPFSESVTFNYSWSSLVTCITNWRFSLHYRFSLMFFSSLTVLSLCRYHMTWACEYEICYRACDEFVSGRRHHEPLC